MAALSVSVSDVAGEFSAAGLPAPPIPEDLAPKLIRLGPLAFGTRDVGPDLYDVEPLVDDWLAGPDEDLLLVGHAGRGRASWAVTYVLTRGRLGLFLQVPFGGVGSDDDVARSRLTGAFEWVSRFLPPRDPEPGRRRLVAYMSGLYGCRWAWAGGDWHEGEWDEVAAAVEAQLQAAGETVEAEPDGPRLPTLEEFLRTTDLDALAEMAGELPLPGEAELRRLARVTGEWSDRQALANLLLHPILMPADYRYDVVRRALVGDPADYLTFAAAVGAQELHLDQAPAEGRDDLVRALGDLVDAGGPPIVAERASVALAAQHGYVPTERLLGWLGHPDEVVRHNAAVALVAKLGLAGAREAVAEGPVRAEIDRLIELGGWDSPGAYASPLASTRLTYIPDLQEWEAGEGDQVGLKA